MALKGAHTVGGRFVLPLTQPRQQKQHAALQLRSLGVLMLRAAATAQGCFARLVRDACCRLALLPFQTVRTVQKAPEMEGQRYLV